MTGGRFAVIGDLQETSRFEFWREDNRAESELLVRRIADERPAFVVLLGDLVFDGSSPRQWSRFDALVAPLREAEVPMLPILGNHDYGWVKRTNLRHYLDRFPHLDGRRWHARRFGSVELVFLDSNLGAHTAAQRDEQVAWYADALDRADADLACRATLVFVHHPPFTNSTVTRGNADVRRSFVAPFVRARKTRAMVSGHVHSYERFEHGGKTFVVSGGGGGPRVRLFEGRRARHPDLYCPASSSRRPLHYLSVAVSAEGISIEAMGLEKGCRSFAAMETFALALA
jgi:Icc-related predicted phosphoesterase